MTTQPVSQATPKTYRTPKLVVYGDIRAITQTTTVTKSNDGKNARS
jgi:hypothetical protein